jgi:hypothetical protein
MPSNPLETVKQKVFDALDAFGSLLGGVTGPQPMTSAMQPTPSDTLTNPTIQASPTTPATGSLVTPGPQDGALLPNIQHAIGQVQSPGTGNPLIDIPGTAASALGTIGHKITSPVSGASEEFPTGGPLAGPLLGGVREAAGYEQMGRAGATEAQRQLLDLLKRQDAGEPGLDDQINHWTAVYDQATGRGANRTDAG